jgi:HSP20 family protein
MKRRNAAEDMFTDIFVVLKETQRDIEQKVSQYTLNSPLKPLVDVIEDNKNVFIVTELPGVKKEEITIDITDYDLEITAQVNDEGKYKGKRFMSKERKYGKVNRTIKLPAKIKIDDSLAEFENGVLTIILPKLVKKQTFEVKVD